MSSMREFTVNVSKLLGSQAGTEIYIELNADAQSLGVPELQGCISGSLRILKGTKDVMVVGSVLTDLATPCRLCLDPIVKSTEIELEGRFVDSLAEDIVPESPNYDPDVFPLDVSGNLDLSDLARQCIVSSIDPNIDCNGSCEGYDAVLSAFGSDISDDIDPRWEPLKGLMKRSVDMESQQLKGDD